MFCKKNVFLKISQNSLENTCARVPFLNTKRDQETRCSFWGGDEGEMKLWGILIFDNSNIFQENNG